MYRIFDMHRKGLTQEKYYRATLDHFDQHGQWPTNSELAFELDVTPGALVHYSNTGEMNGEIKKERKGHNVHIRLDGSIIRSFRMKDNYERARAQLEKEQREQSQKPEEEYMSPSASCVSGGYVGKIKPNGGTINMDIMTTAIKNSVSGGLKDEEAKSMAQHIMNFFGYQERIIDNILNQEDRDAFYMLEDSGLLTTEREETTLYDGREWRIHYWIIKKDKLLDIIKKAHKKEETDQKSSTIYDDIPEHVWSKHGNENDDETEE